ncbi:MAG: hypothetical protein JXA14_22900 [Anaerolineae bacterium]|nr:hypothetical protein [Anaerolineae bacterium]
MAKKTKIVWKTPPNHIIKNIQALEPRILAAIHALAAQVGAKMQNEGRSGAKWQDRTGNARGGLFFAVDGFGLGSLQGGVSPKNAKAWSEHLQSGSGPGGGPYRLVLVFAHSMGYGAVLELDHGGRYAIVLPTMEANIPALIDGLNGLMDRMR